MNNVEWLTARLAVLHYEASETLVELQRTYRREMTAMGIRIDPLLITELVAIERKARKTALATA